MRFAVDVVQSIDENGIDISSAWLFTDSFLYDTSYIEVLNQPVSLEAITLDYVRVKDATTNIEIRASNDKNSTLLWSGISYNVNEQTPTSINTNLQKISTGVVGSTAPSASYGSGTISIQEANINLHDNPYHQGEIKTYAITSASFTLTDGIEQYIVCDYNSGNPLYRLENSRYNINSSDIVLIRVCWRQGNSVHSIDSDCQGSDLANKIESAMIQTEPYKKSTAGGLILSESSSPSARTVLLTSAVVYAASTPHLVSAFNSSINTFTFVYHSSGTWNYTSATQYNNLQYDDGTDLQTLGNNKYGVNWIYRSIGSDVQCFFVLGKNANNTFAAAETETIRTDLPILLRDHCVLVGRIIVQYNASSGVVENVSDVSFITSTISNHNDLNNIQGGASGEYYHLSANDYTKLTTGFTSAVRQKFTATSPIVYTSSTGVFTHSTTGTSGTYTKIVTNSYGHVTSGGVLLSADIPTLPWSKLSNTPTTLSGYGVVSGDSLFDVKYAPYSTYTSVNANSAYWNSTYSTVSANSATWSSGGVDVDAYLPLSGGTMATSAQITVTKDMFPTTASNTIYALAPIVIQRETNNTTTSAVPGLGFRNSGAGVQNCSMLYFDPADARFKHNTGSGGIYTIWDSGILTGAQTGHYHTNLGSYYLPLSGGTLTGAITAQNILPSTTNTYTLGNSSYLWSSIYATNFYEGGTSLASKYLGATSIATGSYFLNKNATFKYSGEAGLQYYDGDFTSVGTSANYNGFQGPTSAWYQVIHIPLSVANYYNELLFPVNDTAGLWWRQRRNASYYGWFKILDSQNFNTYALPLTGGTLTGAITAQNILPSTTNTYSLGTTAKYWSNIYSNTISAVGYIYGNIGIYNNYVQSKYAAMDVSYYSNSTNLMASWGHNVCTLPTNFAIIQSSVGNTLVNGLSELGLQISNSYIITLTSSLVTINQPIKITGNIYPNSTTTYTLGTTALNWNAVYSLNLYENNVALSSKYLALAGGTLTGALVGTSISATTRMGITPLSYASGTNVLPAGTYDGQIILIEGGTGTTTYYLTITGSHSYRYRTAAGVSTIVTSASSSYLDLYQRVVMCIWNSSVNRWEVFNN